MPRVWSHKYSRCINCGTTEYPHKGHGLCGYCYEKHKNKRLQMQKGMAPRGSAAQTVTPEYLKEQYHEKGRSLQDIANELKCTRQYIHKMMKYYEIPRRKRKDSRNLAIGAGKIKFIREIPDGTSIEIKHGNLEIDRDFFYNWSDSLAYILGFIYTDGNLSKATYFSKRGKYINTYSISIAQKDPYILEEIRKTISLNRLVKKRANNKNSYLHYLTFNDKDIFERLESFGLCDNKSLIIKFPEIPTQYLNGFIRGLFDGDGSFYGGHARLTTGSKEFAYGLKNALARVGFKSSITVIKRGNKRKNPVYTVRISTASDSYIRFYKYLYKDAGLFLSRKRKLFEESLRLDVGKLTRELRVELLGILDQLSE